MCIGSALTVASDSLNQADVSMISFCCLSMRFSCSRGVANLCSGVRDYFETLILNCVHWVMVIHHWSCRHM